MSRQHLKTRVIIPVLAFICLLVGIIVGQFFHPGQPSLKNDDTAVQNSDKVSFWTCSMHPQIHQPKPGMCPICGMDLIPVTMTQQETSGKPVDIFLSEYARKLADIQTSEVSRRSVQKSIRMFGRIDYDETRLRRITSWIPGRIDKLYVDYEGIAIHKGDSIAELYSPELIVAQQELIQASMSLKEIKGSGFQELRKSMQETLDASREKLRLWGLLPVQISNIENKGTVSDRLTIYSPISGIVIVKNVTEGMYVQTGTYLYTIADLTHVWLILEAYETDIPWLRYDQDVVFTVAAYPGELFTGQIVYIDPVVNPETRTVRVRVDVSNGNGRLKPNMFARASVKTLLGSEGNVRDAPSTASSGMPLVIPLTAPLITGKRAIVYVETEPGTYLGREVELGPTTDEGYVVLKGLDEGERVVTYGNFKIDSALQILGYPSMMHEPTEPSPTHKANDSAIRGVVPSGKTVKLSETARSGLRNVLRRYFELQMALSRDDLETARASAKAIRLLMNEIPTGVTNDAQAFWQDIYDTIVRQSEEAVLAKSLIEAREAFDGLSHTMLSMVDLFDPGKLIYKFHCPMAFNNRGAYWLQDSKTIANPYFGSVMYSCGELQATIGSTSSNLSQTPDDLMN
ncbi:efflux RND transporter periplasmic adaptor subunit [bacterium]|nr:efflux RND transporter periplasmic adaptor subunit [candidate division CSSED10-310 bacterium]